MKAYQTAYLKHYYKEDFIAATMSTELSNTDKLREFVVELKRLKIKIVRPNINKCYADFKSEKNKIYYALSGIKNVGREAISNVIEERETKGIFKSIDDFIGRVNPKDINKLQLEGLVKAGAFDDLERNRSSLLNSIPNLILKNKSIWEDKVSNQKNLFDMDPGNNDKNFQLTKTKEWSNNDELLNEFKSIGFYMSDHPLNIYKDYFKEMKIISFKNFNETNNSNAVVCGTIMSIQEKKSAKGTPFAIIKFSDLESEFELFLFSDLLIKNRDKLKESSSFILTVQKEKSLINSDTTRINIKNILRLEDFMNKTYKNTIYSAKKH